MNYREFIHLEDEAAMRNLEGVPGFDSVARFVLEHYTEDLMHGLYMAQNVRLSPTQLPEVYNLLPPICSKFGIDLPEFYLTMDPVPNAWTIGDKRKFIVLTSGLLDHITDKQELQSILAHECGHIVCRHVFYNTIARLLVSFGESLGFGQVVLAPILLAIKYWMSGRWQTKRNEGMHRMQEYIPKPLDTSDVSLPESLMPLVEALAENVHDTWAKGRMDAGWRYGTVRDDAKKLHPCLVPYGELPESEKTYDRATAISTLKFICKMGYGIHRHR